MIITHSGDNTVAESEESSMVLSSVCSQVSYHSDKGCEPESDNAGEGFVTKADKPKENATCPEPCEYLLYPCWQHPEHLA